LANRRNRSFSLVYAGTFCALSDRRQILTAILGLQAVIMHKIKGNILQKEVCSIGMS
jgi:hypothetical protein